MSKPDYATAFAYCPNLLALEERLAQAEVEQYGYVLAADSPIFIYPNGLVYKYVFVDLAFVGLEVMSADKSTLRAELDRIASLILIGFYNEQELRLFDLRASKLLPDFDDACGMVDQRSLQDPHMVN
jgi:hypothetical protein